MMQIQGLSIVLENQAIAPPTYFFGMALGGLYSLIQNFYHINILKWDSKLGPSEQSYLNLD